MTKGVDYSYDHPSIEHLKESGYDFACRYLTGAAGTKELTAGELAILHRSGIAVVAVFESTADRALNGFTAGSADAKTAISAMNRLGFPGGRPCYFAVDFDVQSSQVGTIREYFRGACDVLGVSRVGVYGGKDIVTELRKAGLAMWAWQTYAWSDGVWYVGNDIEQYQNGVPLLGGTVDLNRAKVSDYGGWLPMTAPKPASDGLDPVANEVLHSPQVTGYTDDPKGLVSVSGALTALGRWTTGAESTLGSIEASVSRLSASSGTPAVDVVALASALAGSPAFIANLGAAIAEQLRPATASAITSSTTLLPVVPTSTPTVPDDDLGTQPLPLG